MTEIRTAKSQTALTLESLEKLAVRATEYMALHLSNSTKRAYAYDFKTYSSWCDGTGLRAMPADPKVIALYITALADSGLAVASIERALAGIAKAHETKGISFDRKANPIKFAMAGIRRAKEVRPHRVDAITIDELKALVETQDVTNLRGLRNRSILTLGFAGGFRRSELASLAIGDITLRGKGVRILVRKSKTDQEGAGQEIGIVMGSNEVTCPLANLEAWLEVRGKTGNGSLFCKVNHKGTALDTSVPITGRLVARTIQTAQAIAGINDRWFAGHSLRAGLVTAAVLAGKSLPSIQATTRHKNVEMLMRYIRRNDLFEDSASEGIGL